MVDSKGGWGGRAVRGLAWLLAGLVIVGAAGAGALWLALRSGGGPSSVSVPNLARLPEEDAVRTAAGAGLVAEVVDARTDPDVAAGLVLEQQPAAGVEVRRGRKVRIVMSLGGSRLDVPSLAGDAAREVEIRLTQMGLASGDEARVYVRRSEAGTVAAQVPPAGARAATGTVVHRLISEGPVPARWVMPDLKGRPLAEVEAWIARAGFRKGSVRRVPAPGVAPGIVVDQEPASGWPIPSKGVIALTVAP